MIQIRIQGKKLQKTSAYAHQLAGLCNRLHRSDDAFADVEVLGPIEAPLSRIADHFRWQLLLKSAHAGALHRFARGLPFQPAISGKSRRCIKASASMLTLFS